MGKIGYCNLLEGPKVTINPCYTTVALVMGGQQPYKGVAVIVGDGPVAAGREFGNDHVHYSLAVTSFHVPTSCSCICPVIEFSTLAG